MAYNILDALKDMGRLDLKLVPDNVQELRMNICKICPHLGTLMGNGSLLSICNKCKCLLEGKTRLEKSTCPEGKW
jgi:hypothetical protein